jgi:glutamate racemase
VELIEAGETEGARMEAALHALLDPHLQKPVKAVVLGCTPYVFLRGVLGRLLPPDAVLVDGNLGTARQLQTRLSESGLLSGRTTPAPPPRFFSTAEDAAVPLRMAEWFGRALAESPARLQSPGH